MTIILYVVLIEGVLEYSWYAEVIIWCVLLVNWAAIDWAAIDWAAFIDNWVNMVVHRVIIFITTESEVVNWANIFFILIIIWVTKVVSGG